jgi:ABC-type phosphate/phosphonate transport system substrate-binding protein
MPLRSQIVSLLLAATCAATSAGAGERGARGNDGAEERRPLRIAFSKEQFPNINANDANAAIQVWVTIALGRNGFAYDPETAILPNTEAVLETIEAGSYDIYSLPTSTYIAVATKEKIEPGAVGEFESEDDLRLCLVSRNGTDIRALADLQGFRLIIDRHYTLSLPEVWMDVLLMREGYPRTADMASKISNVSKVSQAVIPVFMGQADGCIVQYGGYRTMVELNPQIGEETRIIARSESYYGGHMFWNAKLPEEVRRDILRQLVTLHEFPEGQQILTLFGVKRMVAIDRERHLAPVEKLFDEHRRLMQAGSGRAGEARTRTAGAP